MSLTAIQKVILKLAYRALWGSGSEQADAAEDLVDSISTPYGGVTGTSSGTGSFSSGTGSVASGEEAYAVGKDSLASGIMSVAIGQQAQATSTYATALGAYTQATAAGAFAAGEYSLASAANATAIGYYCQATAAFANALGSYCYATARGATALGLGGYASVAGQLAHCSTPSAIGQWCAVDAYNGSLAAAPGTLLVIGTDAITLPAYSLLGIRLSIVASTAGRTKVAHEVRELTVSTGAGTATIENETTLYSGKALSAHGWTLTIGVSAQTLTLTFNPGSDTVKAIARMEWQELGGLQ